MFSDTRIAACLFVVVFTFATSTAQAEVAPISIENLEKAIDSVAASPGDQKLQAITGLLAGLGIELRLVKGDTIPLPLDTAAQLQVGKLKITSKDGSDISFDERGVAILGYDGIWRKPKDEEPIRFRASIVVSKRYIFVNDLQSGLTSRILRPPVPTKI